MPDSLDLSLPPAPAPRGRGDRTMTLALALVVLLQAAVIVISLVRGPGGDRRAERTTAARLNAEAQRELALKLEQQGLTESAVAAWQAYLEAKQADTTKAAEIWYRIGTLWQEARRYEPALVAYYTSERYAALPHLEAELGRRVQECLDAQGRYAALRYELKDRTEIRAGAAADGTEVVAEIGPQRLTKADLDRLIEHLVTAQLGRLEPGLDPAAEAPRRQALMKQFADHAVRRQILAQYLAEEVLSREARAERLTDQAEVRARLQDAERRLLAGMMLERELAAKVQITPGDVQTYYRAHPEEFRQPEQARLAHILVADEEKAKALIASLATGPSFEDLAASVSQDAATAKDKGTLPGLLVRGRDDLPGVGRLEGLSAAVFGAAAGSVLPAPFKSAAGWHVVRVVERLPESLPPFEQVEAEAHQRLRQRKQQEVQEGLLKRLYQAHGVVIHEGALQPAAPPPPSPAPAPQP